VVPLDINDARTFLKAADEHRLAALGLILVTTGLRRGEALGLTWADIDLGRRHCTSAGPSRRSTAGTCTASRGAADPSERSGFPPAPSPPSAGTSGSPLTGLTWSTGGRYQINPPTSSL
jgi:hypothetical protein